MKLVNFNLTFSKNRSKIQKIYCAGGEKMSPDATWAEFQKKALLRLKKHIF